MDSTLRRLPFFALMILICAPAISLRAQPQPDGAKGFVAALQPFVERHSLAGAVVLVADREKVLALGAVGYSDVAARTPMGTDAMFWIASMSKPMTAAALMMLVDEGKVNVDDPVEKYLPEFKGQRVAVEQDKDHTLLKPPAHPVTIKNVLSHTSGIPFMSRVELVSHHIDTLPLRTAGYTYAMSDLQFEPDTKYQYSNAGINTAGRIIEVASGMPYEKFMEERLFKPLGMVDTTFWPNDGQLKRLAKSYKPNSAKNDLEETDINQLTYPLTDRSRGPSPAGGLFSTASDCAAFGRMILNRGTLDGKRYLSEKAVHQMTSNQIGDVPINGKTDSGYGFGFSTVRNASADEFTAAGHGGAYATDMQVDPQHGLVTIYMVQHAGFAGDGAKAKGVFMKEAVQVFGK